MKNAEILYKTKGGGTHPTKPRPPSYFTRRKCFDPANNHLKIVESRFTDHISIGIGSPRASDFSITNCKEYCRDSCGISVMTLLDWLLAHLWTISHVLLEISMYDILHDSCTGVLRMLLYTPDRVLVTLSQLTKVFSRARNCNVQQPEYEEEHQYEY
ncbi:hypothetical protein CBL_10983 [Carabus blaptoides fortunei]